MARKCLRIFFSGLFLFVVFYKEGNTEYSEILRIKHTIRKVENEDGIQLPFTYIGKGHMEFIEGSKKDNGAYLFRIPMEKIAPEDIFFDFKLPNDFITE